MGDGGDGLARRSQFHQFMATDSIAVLKHGVELGTRTWKAFLRKLGWVAEQVDKVICHQVGSGHRETILEALGIDPNKEFSTFPYLGNIGTVSLPLTAALAEERDFLRPGDRVGLPRDRQRPELPDARAGMVNAVTSRCETNSDLRRLPRRRHPGRDFDRDGLRLHYLDEGEGEPVVMVHGNPTWSFYYRKLVEALTGSYRTIVPDHIGCGLSDKPGDDRYAYTLESRVDDLEALLDHLGRRPAASPWSSTTGAG